MNILIIDDDEIKVEHLTKKFTKDMKYTWAKSYNEGIRNLEENEYDCVFLDMNFPQMNNTRIEKEKGLEFLKFIDRSSKFKDKKIPPFVIYSSVFVKEAYHNPHVVEYMMYDGHDLKDQLESIKKIIYKLKS